VALALRGVFLMVYGGFGVVHRVERGEHKTSDLSPDTTAVQLLFPHPMVVLTA